MEQLRKPGQGVWNIIRFNWHFYVLAAGAVLLLSILINFSPPPYRVFGILAGLLVITPTLLSLLVSYYVYDASGLYRLDWLNVLRIPSGGKFVNINAGFDETSHLLQSKFPAAELVVFDFYNPATHTEVSIRRARKAYPAYPGTRQVPTNHLPLPDGYADVVFIIFAAHEIRNTAERISFFQELRRVLKQDGTIVVTEHLRDLPNFLAYNLGAFHFLPKASWRRAFQSARLQVLKEIKTTPFVTTFMLEHGTTD